MNRDIKKIVSYYKRKTGTSDPFAIADQLGILYQICNLQFEGCYMFLKITATFLSMKIFRSTRNVLSWLMSSDMRFCTGKRTVTLLEIKRFY